MADLFGCCLRVANSSMALPSVSLSSASRATPPLKPSVPCDSPLSTPAAFGGCHTAVSLSVSIPRETACCRGSGRSSKAAGAEATLPARSAGWTAMGGRRRRSPTSPLDWVKGARGCWPWCCPVCAVMLGPSAAALDCAISSSLRCRTRLPRSVSSSSTLPSLPGSTWSWPDSPAGALCCPSLPPQAWNTPPPAALSPLASPAAGAEPTSRVPRDTATGGPPFAKLPPVAAMASAMMAAAAARAREGPPVSDDRSRATQLPGCSGWRAPPLAVTVPALRCTSSCTSPDPSCTPARDVEGPGLSLVVPVRCLCLRCLRRCLSSPIASSSSLFPPALSWPVLFPPSAETSPTNPAMPAPPRGCSPCSLCCGCPVLGIKVLKVNRDLSPATCQAAGRGNVSRRGAKATGTFS